MKQTSASIENEEFNFICTLIAMAHRNLNLNGDNLVKRVTEIFGSPKVASMPEDLVARIREASPEVALRGDFFFPYGGNTMSRKDRQYLDAVKSIIKEAFY